MTTYPSNVETVREWRAPVIHGARRHANGMHASWWQRRRPIGECKVFSAGPRWTWAVRRHVTSRFKSRDGMARRGAARRATTSNSLPHHCALAPADATTWRVTSRPADCALVPAPHCRRAPRRAVSRFRPLHRGSYSVFEPCRGCPQKFVSWG